MEPMHLLSRHLHNGNPRHYFNRRIFLKVVGALTTSVFLSSHAMAQANVTDESPPVMSLLTLPVVYGEPAVVEVVIPENLVITTQDVNFRTEPSTRGGVATSIVIREGSYLEIVTGKEDLEDLDGSSQYRWVGVQLVYDTAENIVPADARLGYIAHGFFTSVLDDSRVSQFEIPKALLEARYQQQVAMPVGEHRLTNEQLVELGTTVLSANVIAELNAAWGSVIGGNEKDAASQLALRAWQVAVLTIGRKALAHIDDPLLDWTETSDFVESQALRLYVHERDSMADVISRLHVGEQELFIIVRLEWQIGREATSTGIISNIGFATWEGLSTAYGPDEAYSIAAQTTVLEDDASLQLAHAIGQLSQAAVFLPAMDQSHQFAPILEHILSESVSDQQEESAKTGFWTYLREPRSDSQYRAERLGTQGEAHDPTLLQAMLYFLPIANAEAGSWIPAPDRGLVTELVVLYSSVVGYDASRVEKDLTFIQKLGPDETIHLFLAHQDVPLLAWKTNQDGELSWGQATPRFVGEARPNPFSVHISVDGAEEYQRRAYIRTYQMFSGLSPSGSFTQQGLEDYPTQVKLFLSNASGNRMAVRVHGSFFHQAMREYFEANKLIKFTHDEMVEFVHYHVKAIYDALEPYRERLANIEIIFANEMKWYSQGYSDWEQSPLYENFGPDWPVETYLRLYEEAVERGYHPGSDVNFMYNDYGVELDGAKAAMIRSELSRIRVDIGKRLGIQSEQLPMVMGLQFWGDFTGERAGLLNAKDFLQMQREDAIHAVAENVRLFASVMSGTIKAVKATEIATYGSTEEEQEEYVYRIVRGLVLSEQADSVGFWSPIRWEKPEDLSLFKAETTWGEHYDPQYVPRKPYFALLKGLFED